MFMTETGLNCLQGEGLWGLRRRKLLEPDPGRGGFLKLGVQRAADSQAIAYTCKIL